MQTVKMVITGPFSAGKTEFIRSISEIEVVSTDQAITSAAEKEVKSATTVAMDFGRITVDDDLVLYLFGTPGQRRFDFMWRILRDRAEGMVLLVHNDGPDPVNAMREFLIEFDDLCRRGGAIVGITRMDVGPGPTLTNYSDVLEFEHPDLTVPVMAVDPRDRGNMELLMMTMIANLEMRAAYAPELSGGVLA